MLIIKKESFLINWNYKKTSKMNRFTVTAKVTFINELHLNFRAVLQMQRRGKVPTEFDVEDRNTINESEILIFRASKKFKEVFEPARNLPVVVLKSKY